MEMLPFFEGELFLEDDLKFRTIFQTSQKNPYIFLNETSNIERTFNTLKRKPMEILPFFEGELFLEDELKFRTIFQTSQKNPYIF